MTVHRGNAVTNLFFLLKVFGLRKHQTVVEIGSGTGFLTWFLSKRGYSVTGSEINKNYLSYARDFFQIDLKTIQPPELPFNKESTDVVCSFDVLEHIPNTHDHLQQVYSILKPGGFYVFSTPNKLTNLPFEVLKEKSFTKYKEYHCSLHTYWELRAALEQAGFRVQFCKVPIVNTYFKQKLRTYLGSWILPLIKVLNPDTLPLPFRTNFHVIAQKSV